MLARLTVNKPAFLTAEVMAVLWTLYVAATLGLIAVAVTLARSRMSYTDKFSYDK